MTSESLPEQNNDSLQNITDKISDLPVLPDAGLKVLKSINDDNLSQKQLSEFISADPIITTKLLKLANSAFYAMKFPVTTIAQSVNMLGIDTVRQMVLSLGFMDMTRVSRRKENQQLAKDFWLHSLATAYTTKTLAKLLHFQMVGGGEAYLAGLIHDIGIHLLAKYEKENYTLILEKVAEEKRPLFEVEQEILGVTHNDIGAWLVEQWQLPSVLIEAVKDHHNIEKAEISPEFCILIYLSDLLCEKREIGLVEYAGTRPIHSSALKLLRKRYPDTKDEDIFTLLNEELNDHFEELNELLGSFGAEDKKETDEEREVAIAEKWDKKKHEEIKKGKEDTAPTTLDPKRWISLICPGLGQILTGKPKLGGALFVVFLISLIVAVDGLATSGVDQFFIIGLFGMVVSYLGSLIDLFK